MEAEGPIYDRCATVPNVAISFVLCLLVTMGFAAVCPQVLHWSSVPILACGVLVGTDAIAWLRGQVDTFDPKGIVGVFGVHFFFVAPLIQSGMDIELLDRVSDPRPWLGAMACLNILGLVCYFVMRNLGTRGRPPTADVTWRVDPAKAGFILPLAIVVAAIAHAYVFVTVGGFAGIVQAHEVYGGESIYSGTGIPKLLANALPFLLLMLLTLMRRQGSYRRSTFIAVAVVLILLLIVQFTISGLKGSRSPILFRLVGFVAVVHFFWRRVAIKHIVVGTIPLLLFLYLYAFYKDVGREALQLFTRGQTVEQMTHRTGRTFTRMLIGDLARANIQGYILYVLRRHPDAYDLRWGKTYYASMTALIPGWIWPGKPRAEKVIASTDLIWGRGYYRAHRQFRRSQQVHGLAGEAMLNFSWTAVPFAFAIWGFAVGRFRRRLLYRLEGDSRFFLAGLYTLFTIKALMGDLDNQLWYVVLYIMVPAAMVWLVSVRVRHTHDLIASVPRQQSLVTSPYVGLKTTLDQRSQYPGIRYS